MSVIDLIHNIYVPNIIVKTEEHPSFGRTISLKETASQAKTKKITIKNVPETCLAIKLDGFIPKNSFLLGRKGELSRCDYILIAEDKHNCFLFYIELKSKKTNNASKQFRSSVCLMEYCEALAVEFHQDHIMCPDIIQRFVVFQRKPCVKRPINYSPHDWKNNTSDRFQRIYLTGSENLISFRELSNGC
ncbi:MAG: hypothetical protein GXY81_05300 [Candidatus Cloacimonetes bacterium]|nr:hypothetical protein [Candidatus Cloacimonadota bacterium]